MVLFFDLDGESSDDDPYIHHNGEPPHGLLLNHNSEHRTLSFQEKQRSEIPIARDGSGGRLSAVLACYPVTECIAAELDLNDLFSLSLTCHGIHSSLNQYAHQLKAHSLRCVHDITPLSTQDEELASPISLEVSSQTPLQARSDVDIAVANALLARAAVIAGAWTGYNRGQFGLGSVGRLDSALGLSGKVGQCARDLVAECRRCGTTVCRNCTAKPPSDKNLRDRVRRLCNTCLAAPIADHMKPLYTSGDIYDSQPTSSASSTRSGRSSSSSSDNDRILAEDRSDHSLEAVAAAFRRDPCMCATRGAYLCEPCGHNLRAADTTYKRVWTWRSRYSTHIGGGLGTGLGLGNEGQKCGRGQHCLSTGSESVCWVETEYSDNQTAGHGRDALGLSDSPAATENSNKPGYFSQEIEGIGQGVMKKKVKKRVKVGMTCTELANERETGKYLEFEASGKQRSWCGWCNRVCPGELDRSV